MVSHPLSLNLFIFFKKNKINKKYEKKIIHISLKRWRDSQCPSQTIDYVNASNKLQKITIFPE